jgi:hypothetical protein
MTDFLLLWENGCQMMRVKNTQVFKKDGQRPAKRDNPIRNGVARVVL